MALDFAKEAIQNASTHSINFDELKAGKANIKVIGCGGCGSNMVTWLFNKGINGATIYACNTDALHLSVTKSDEKILIGKELTRGLGAGGAPGRGREVAKESGAVVIGVVTMPFESEKARIDKAEFGLQELRDVTDTCIVLDNNRLVDIAGQLPIEQAFAVANELVSTMVKGIVETITLPSLINLDYADVSSIMKDGGVSVIGIGEADTQDRVNEAVRQALTHPLLDVDYKGASGALIHVTCGPDLKLEEFDIIGRTVSENLNPDAQVIIGARISKDFVGKVRVITIMTGVKSPYVLGKDSG